MQSKRLILNDSYFHIYIKAKLEESGGGTDYCRRQRVLKNKNEVAKYTIEGIYQEESMKQRNNQRSDMLFNKPARPASPTVMSAPSLAWMPEPDAYCPTTSLWRFIGTKTTLLFADLAICCTANTSQAR